MIIIRNTAIIKEIKNFLSFLHISFKQQIFFYYLNLVRGLREKYKEKIKSNSIIFSTSNSKYRSWHTYQKLCSKPSKKIINKFGNGGKFIKYIRIVVPGGLRSLRNLKINIKEINKNLNKSELISKDYFISNKNLDYFRNLNKIDLKFNTNIKEFTIQNDREKVGVQIFESVAGEESNISNTIYIVLDAVSYQSFLNSQTYETFLSKSKHLLYETFSPSSLTGSALPSLLTLKPVFCHLLGDYDEWFFSPNLECLSPKIPTIAEKLQEKLQETNAFTSFSKTMPFYGYYRGFDYYYNRCSGNNFSPSSLELFFSYLIENKDFTKCIGSSFTFVHDIGGHAPGFPSFDKDTNLHQNLSYFNSVDISLSKIRSLILNLESEGKLDKTNLIITADHTQSFGLKKTSYHLFPNRISVPVFFKPSINVDFNYIEKLKFNSEKIPSSFLISEILNRIYDLELSHPKFYFDGISWISSVFEYPKRKKIYTLGYDDLNKEFICAKISTSIFNLSESFNVENIQPVFFKINNNKISPLTKDSKNFKRFSESFRKYIFECNGQLSYPVKQYFF